MKRLADEFSNNGDMPVIYRSTDLVDTEIVTRVNIIVDLS